MAMPKGSKKKRSVNLPRSYDEKHMGTEPSWTKDVAPNRSQIAAAYNWYNYFFGDNNKVKLLFDHYPRDRKEIRQLRKLPNWKFPGFVCWKARMATRGYTFKDEDMVHFHHAIDALLVEAKEVVAEKKVEKVDNKPSVQDRIKAQINEYIGDIEVIHDQFVIGNYTPSDFNMYEWLQKNEVKAQQTNAIGSFFELRMDELILARDKKDPQCVEAFERLSKKQLKAYIEFFTGIVADCNSWAGNQVIVRKPRAKKAPSLDKQVSRVKYCKSHAALQLVSVNPLDLIGAKSVWLFDAKYRTLARLDCSAKEGFTIKGTTLQNVDVDNSNMKKLRKPEDHLKNVLTAGKRALGKIFEEITTKEIKPNGRLNDNTVILRVTK